MKSKRLISFILGCLLVMETPLVSQAADFSATPNPAADISVQSEAPVKPDIYVQAEAPSKTDISVQAEVPGGSETGFHVTLNQNAASLNTGDTLQLTPSYSGYDKASASEPQVTWTADHTDILSVSEQGLVTAIKAGNATVTATATLTVDGKTYTASSSCTVTVADTITLNKKKLTLYTTETAQLDAIAASGSAVTWHSSNDSVVYVDSKGKLSPKKTGTATITATVNGISASCEVTVKAPTMKLAASKTIYLKNPVTLKANVAPKGKVTWKSSDKKIAKVNSKGKVTPQKTGTVKITASCHGLKQTCKITVKKPSIKLKTKDTVIFAESSLTIGVSARPSSELTYRSSNPKVAKVSRSGKITGVRSGTATITASVPGAKESFELTVLKNDHKLSHSSETLMEGSSSTIYMSNASAYDNVTFEVSDPSIAKVAPSGNSCKITARHAGKTSLNAYYTTYLEGQSITCKRSCTVNVINSGIVEQQEALAVGASKTLTLKHVDKPDAVVTGTAWSSSNPSVADIGPQSGKVKALKFGSAKITAVVSYSDGTDEEYMTDIKVSTPKVKNKRTVVSLGRSQKIALSGLTSFSETTWKLKRKSLVSINPDGTVTAGKKTGKTDLTIKVDGKTIKHTIIVTNPKLKTNYALIAPKTTTKIKLSGVAAESKISYRSRKKSVATVSKSGVITARKCGKANIVVTADGNSFNFQVEVSPQRAIDACNTGYSIMYSSSYSQARRMSTGYYDCSSLVFRSYGCDTGLLGGISSWAPTAASMASYLQSTGKVISYRGVDVSKLLPGDLIFYKAPYNNGRFKNIYHVSMYYGNGFRLEKPLREYYPESHIVMVARPLK